MPPHAPPDWHPLVEHLAIQGVEESIALGHGAVGPGIRPAHPHKLSVAGEGGTPLLDLLHAPPRPRQAPPRPRWRPLVSADPRLPELLYLSFQQLP